MSAVDRTLAFHDFQCSRVASPLPTKKPERGTSFARPTTELAWPSVVCRARASRNQTEPHPKGYGRGPQTAPLIAIARLIRELDRGLATAPLIVQYRRHRNLSVCRAASARACKRITGRAFLPV